MRISVRTVFADIVVDVIESESNGGVRETRGELVTGTPLKIAENSSQGEISILEPLRVIFEKSLDNKDLLSGRFTTAVAALLPWRGN